MLVLGGESAGGSLLVLDGERVGGALRVLGGERVGGALRVLGGERVGGALRVLGGGALLVGEGESSVFLEGEGKSTARIFPSLKVQNCRNGEKQKKYFCAISTNPHCINAVTL